jgi:hypothetical protein
MSKFADMVAGILGEVVDSARPAQMFRINTTALGKAGSLGEELALELVTELECQPQEVTLDARVGPCTIMVGESPGLRRKFILCHASHKPPQSKSPVFVSENFAANIRDERVNPRSPIYGHIPVVLTDRVIDTVRASEELTDPGRPLEAGQLIQEIASQAKSPEFRTFVQAASDELRQSAIRGRAEYRGRVMESLSQLATEAKPDIGAALPNLGGWIQDAKFSDYLREANPQALGSRLRANSEAAETIRAATEGKSDPVTVLEKKIRDEKVDRWAKATVDRADLTEWEKDRRREAGAPTKKWDRFRFVKKNIATGSPVEGMNKRKTADLLVWGNEAFQIAAVYKEWPEAPPIQLDIDGRPVFKGKAAQAPPEHIKVEGKSIVLLSSPSAEWSFSELKIFTGKQQARGSPDATVRLARAPALAPSLFLPAFAVNVEEAAIDVANGADFIVAETQLDYTRAARGGEVHDAHSVSTVYDLPCRILNGPDETSTWKFRVGDAVLEIPLKCTGARLPPPDESTFTSGLHNLAVDGHGPAFWTYLPRIRAISAEGQERHPSVPVIHELAREHEIVEHANLFPLLSPGGSIVRGDIPAMVRGVATFAAVLDRYEALVDWLKAHETLPTLVGNSSEFRTIVQTVLDAADQCIEDEETDVETLACLWRIGAIVNDSGDLQSTSPLWLPTLAYWATMYDASLAGQLPDSRRGLLTPASFAPCSMLGMQNRGGRALPSNGASGFWLAWRNAQHLGDAAIPNIGRTIRDRLREFAEAFPLLVAYHEHAPMLVQFIGVTPTKDIADGIQEFLAWHLKRAETSADASVATGDLRLRLEFFVDDPRKATEFDDRMAPENINVDPDFGMDPLHECVDYAKRSLNSLVLKGPHWAHLTFIGRGFRHVSDTFQSADLLPKARANWLVTAPTLDLPALANHNPDRIAFGKKGATTPLGPAQIALKFSELQACVAQGKPFGYRNRGQVLAAMATVQTYASLKLLYDKSIWVTHLEPGVSLVPLKQDKHHESVLIHFTEQVNPTVAGFDEVTLTKQKKAFDNCIEGICRDLKIKKPDGLLPLLNSINPRWALQLFSNNPRRRMEKIACALAAQAALERARSEAPAALWLVAGWEDFNRLTPATGMATSEGAFGPGTRMGTDDVILLGLNAARPRSIRPLLVEVKYGHSGEAKGIAQVQETHQHLTARATTPGLRGQMFRMELGAYALRVAERLFVHNAISKADLETVERCQSNLYEGDFELDWGDHDHLPSKGIVIRIDPDAGQRSKADGADGIEVERIPWAETSNLDATALTGTTPTTVPSNEPKTRPARQDSHAPAEPKAPVVSKQPTPMVATEESVLAKSAKPDVPANIGPVGWTSAVLAAAPVPAYEPPKINRDPFYAIDDMLHQLGVEVEPPAPDDVVVGPQATAVHVKLARGTRVAKVDQALTNLKLSLGVTKDLSLSHYERAGYVTLFVPHESKGPVPLTGYLKPDLRGNLELPVPAGMTAENKPLWVDLVQTNHLLVAGSTGSGKTVYLQGLVLALASALPPRSLRINLVDPKQLDFTVLDKLPHCDRDVVSDVDSTLTLLQELLREVAERQAKLKAAGCRNIGDYLKRKDSEPLPYIVTIIDEYNQLLMSSPDKETRQSLEDHVCQLAQIGRALGLYLVVATQRPSADVVSGRIKANFPTRISFRLPSNTDSRVILDEGGAESLQPGGDGLITGLGGLRRFQAFYLGQEECGTLVEAMGALAPKYA